MQSLLSAVGVLALFAWAQVAVGAECMSVESLNEQIDLGRRPAVLDNPLFDSFAEALATSTHRLFGEFFFGHKLSHLQAHLIFTGPTQSFVVRNHKD